MMRYGFLIAQHGLGGGVQLARKPEEIYLGELLYLGEMKPKIVDCEDGIGGACRIAQASRLQGFSAQAQRAFLEVMNSHTLDEVISKPKLASLFDPWASK